MDRRTELGDASKATSRNLIFESVNSHHHCRDAGHGLARELTPVLLVCAKIFLKGLFTNYVMHFSLLLDHPWLCFVDHFTNHLPFKSFQWLHFANHPPIPLA